MGVVIQARDNMRAGANAVSMLEAIDAADVQYRAATDGGVATAAVPEPA